VCHKILFYENLHGLGKAFILYTLCFRVYETLRGPHS